MSETHVDPMWVQVSYLVAAVLFILALKSMSSPRTCLLYTSDAADE